MREIVIGGLGVDRWRELCARPSPELPVDRNVHLQRRSSVKIGFLLAP